MLELNFEALFEKVFMDKYKNKSKYIPVKRLKIYIFMIHFFRFSFIQCNFTFMSVDTYYLFSLTLRFFFFHISSE